MELLLGPARQDEKNGACNLSWKRGSAEKPHAVGVGRLGGSQHPPLLFSSIGSALTRCFLICHRVTVRQQLFSFYRQNWLGEYQASRTARPVCCNSPHFPFSDFQNHPGMVLTHWPMAVAGPSAKRQSRGTLASRDHQKGNAGSSCILTGPVGMVGRKQEPGDRAQSLGWEKPTAHRIALPSPAIPGLKPSHPRSPERDRLSLTYLLHISHSQFAPSFFPFLKPVTSLSGLCSEPILLPQ